MENSEPIVIDSDSESETWTTSDKNHNIEKNVPSCMKSCSPTHSVVEECSTDQNVQHHSTVTQKPETNKIFDVYDSDDALRESKDGIRVSDSSDAGVSTANVDEPMECVDLIKPAIEPIAARTRSTRRPNTVSYCEDSLNTSYGISNADVQGSSYRSGFPRTATKAKFEVEPSRIPKNNDKTVFHSNYLYKSFCFLCGAGDKHLAEHYAKCHPKTEVFVSRLSPTMAIRIRKQNDEFIQIDDKIHGVCFFCEELMTLKRDLWMKHLIMHTGERMFFCSGCQQKQIKKIKHDKCTKDEVTTVFDVNSPDNNDLCGYICNTCNYVQIHRGQLDKHVGNEHDSYDENIEEIYSKVVLVKAPVL